LNFRLLMLPVSPLYRRFAGSCSTALATLGTMALIASVTMLCAPAYAQLGNTVKLIVPFAVGGPTDIAARVVAPLLSEATGKNIVVENKVGATGGIGAEFVARSAPDGNTILFGTSSIMSANPALVAKLSYDPVRDFAPVSLVAQIENVLVVHPSVPANTVQEFVKFAKANPNKLAYGSSGIGSTYHLGAEYFSNLAGLQMNHVPYKGQGPAAQDLLAGHLQVMFDAFNFALPNIKAGKVKALGMTGAKRHPDLPDLPTIAEQGVPYVTTMWIAFFLPAKTPSTIVDKLQKDLAGILQKAEVKERFNKLGMTAASSQPSELDALLRKELAQWSKVVKDANIKAE
jgi:tripartite-type tricarboxylate transporter receptor subunit TctC